jgi:LCP family protein required for cell wall assembly
MRLRLAAGLVLLGLVAWVVANAMVGPPHRAGAQTPTIEIQRAQRAGYLPQPGRDRLIVVLAIGSDARPGERVDRLRADSIHLITVNPRRGAGTILGFPRDSYVNIPGRGTAKINEAMVVGGPPLLARTVENITGIRIDYWMLTSFRAFTRMVHAIGGLQVRIPYPMNDRASGTHFKRGPKKLSGTQALAFSRDRHSPRNGDFGRSKNQGTLILAALRKFSQQFQTSPTVLFRWLRAGGFRRVKTDLSLGELIDLGLLAAQMNPGRFRNVVAPGSVGKAGSASIVHLSSSARRIFRDIRADGILNR